MRYVEQYDISDHEDSEPLAVKIRMPKKHTLRNVLLIILGVILLIIAGIFIYSKFIFDPLSPSIKNFPYPITNFILFIRKLF